MSARVPGWRGTSLARAAVTVLAALCGPSFAVLAASAHLAGARAPRIDRRALVTRHDVIFDRIDPASPLMVGNGNFGFTADITGLQTFPGEYASPAPLLTEAQWAWHSFPNPEHYRYQDSLVPAKVRGQIEYYPWFRDLSQQATHPAIRWLRENPHRLSLARVSLYLSSASGRRARFADLSATHQRLDLWNGVLRSRFKFDGDPVSVETRVHPRLDMLVLTLVSPALAAGKLGVELSLPGVSANLEPDPGDWSHPRRYRTIVTGQSPDRLSLECILDATRYYVTIGTSEDIAYTRMGLHAFRFLPRSTQTTGPPHHVLTMMVLFSQQPFRGALPSAAAARTAVSDHWHRFWERGGAVDLSGSTDPRALELERRIVLSQYLMAVNAAGTYPPQETGLFSNSWYGKFHLEMHPWHEAWLAVWGHPALLERSMSWYLRHLGQAQARARAHGWRGAMWPKMVGPGGRESPSPINPFIMWQQPGPIYLSELLYRAEPSRATLLRYRELVFQTADLLASFPHFDHVRGEYVLGPPIIPAQEVFPPLTTFDPAFELEYFRFGLRTAQKWRRRLGLAPEPRWAAVLAKLAPLPQSDGLYVPAGSAPQFWRQARSAACSPRPSGSRCLNRDHPSLLGALGLLPGADVDREAMRRTLTAVLAHWDLRQTWGWDFPLMAMTATRLDEPREAVDLLFHDAPNNRWGPAGMTPREHLTDAGTYQLDGETYFPSNGSLLLAVALMTAGWDGELPPNPGFPHDGRWRVRTEGVSKLP
ncbi:MAG TPA: hypothetical protein VGT07_15320 [Steroidobacteraceae bacterium]|nr:hypothetical protein [Steroidobacteraceae bacterium]